jgi:hypothetical protein
VWIPCIKERMMMMMMMIIYLTANGLSPGGSGYNAFRSYLGIYLELLE